MQKNLVWPVVAAGHRDIPAGSRVAVANGVNAERLALVRQLREAGFDLPVLIHPTAAVSKLATLAGGTVVMAQAAVNAGATVGLACIINTGATVDHDCVLGDSVHVSPGAHLAGSVVAEEASWIGVGAAVKQGMRIGAGAVVGAGACVVSNVRAGQTVLGIPARERT